MMATTMLLDPHFQAVNSSGVPLSGAQLFTYATGTTTPVTVYQDSAAATPHANPVVADSTGLFAPIYITSANIKLVLKTAAGVVVQTIDPVTMGGLYGDGTVLLPGIAFASDPDTGIYRIGANNIGISANGAKVVDISTTGVQVVGTTLSGNGTVSLPGFSFTADTDSGFYRIGANNVGLALGGVKIWDYTTSSATLTASGPSVAINASAAGTNAIVSFQVGALSRWFLIKENTAEAGANAGSDFGIYAYDDAGSFLSTPIAITRSSGLITLGKGQLKFPATQNASADVNTMDDYEEATWTPVIAFGGASVGLTYSTRTGNSTKIGNALIVNGNYALSAIGSSVGNATLTGLPVAALSACSCVVSLNSGGYATLTAGLNLSISAGATSGTFLKPGTVGATTATDANFSSTSAGQFAIAYIT